MLPAPPPPQVLLMFKVMQRDRLIKRRLRDAKGPSLSHHDGLVTSSSRVLQCRDGERGVMSPKNSLSLSKTSIQSSQSFFHHASSCHKCSRFPTILSSRFDIFFSLLGQTHSSKHKGSQRLFSTKVISVLVQRKALNVRHFFLF